MLPGLRDGVGQVIGLRAVGAPALPVAPGPARPVLVLLALVLEVVGDEDAADGRRDAAEGEEDAFLVFEGHALGPRPGEVV